MDANDLKCSPFCVFTWALMWKLMTGSVLCSICLAKLGDVEATAKTCESIIGDGLLRSNLLLSCVKKAESLLTDNSKPLPAWVSEG